MIGKTLAKAINILPSRFTISISKKILNHKIKKYATLKITGSENLDQITTPTIFVCNHLSNADGIVLSKVLEKIDPTFIAGLKLSNNDVTKIGMNVVKTISIKPEGLDKDGLKEIINTIKRGESILIFPEGTRSRTGSMIEAKKGSIFISNMTGAPFVPIGIYGTEKLLPINKDGKMEGEQFRHSDVCVNIGKQFRVEKIQKDENKKVYEEKELTKVMKKISELLPEDYRGVYK